MVLLILVFLVDGKRDLRQTWPVALVAGAAGRGGTRGVERGPHTAAAEYGLFYAPDTASTAICSIGGNTVTTAGGIRCARNGVARESVLALRVIPADGRELRTGCETIKGVSGYGLNALMIGSEGTLGVVVEATLRLRPMPVHTATVAALFPDVTTAARAASAVVAARIQPSVMELMGGRERRG